MRKWKAVSLVAAGFLFAGGSLPALAASPSQPTDVRDEAELLVEPLGRDICLADNFGFVWNVSVGGGIISGTVDTSEAVCGVYSVSGSFSGPSFSLTAEGEHVGCCSSFTYTGVADTALRTASGTFTNECGGSGELIMGLCGSPKTVFVMSAGGGNMNGLAGADFWCQVVAELAGLSGRYLAWLSDSTRSPSTRFIRSPDPYVLVDGTVVAEDWTDLTDGTLAAPINYDPSGYTVRTHRSAWTATAPDGTLSDAALTCDDWFNDDIDTGGFGGTGNIDSTDASWTLFESIFCHASLNTYCFEQ